MTTFTDDFARPDGTDLGAGWVEVSGDWAIVSGQLSPGADTGTIVLRAAATVATSDNYAQVTISVPAVASQGVWCRGDATIANGYLFRNNGTSWDLFSVVSGSFTAIGTYAAAAAPGDVARVQAVGSAIKGIVNGVERISVSNTAVTTGTFVGLRSDSVSSIRYDQFIGGDVTAGVEGSAAGVFGGLSGVASGVRTVLGTAAGALGALAGAAVGTRRVNGAAATVLGGLSGTASGARGVRGTAAMSAGPLAGIAVGVRAVSGAAVGEFGPLGTVTATTEETPAAGPGSWYGLLDIVQEAGQLYREDRERIPSACEDCGEPLRTGPRGELYCSFDGSIWGPGGRRLGHVGAASGRW
ncbi:hypothetical protein [Streptomyces sp. KL116D]|uniref:hypothetical protein n=1 Tax=Streptomyces sp. KL116D TaxID=3045152 RepID=UPI003558230B